MERIKAYGKLNLGLIVKGRRADGYHDLKMVTVPIDLFDVLHIEKSDSIHLSTNKWYLPNNQKNTLFQTLKTMEKDFGIDPNYTIKVVKNIPTQAGMGGGSSDAAALINYLDESLNLDMTYDEKMDVALKVGTDVPFCVQGVPAVVSGVGEIVEPFNLNCPFYIFLAKPKGGISTGKLFTNFEFQSSSEERLNKLVEGLTTNQYELVYKNLVNDLQEAAVKVRPEIQTLIDELLEFGFDGACMTGAGSTVFALTQDLELIRKAVTHFFLKVDFVKKSQII